MWSVNANSPCLANSLPLTSFSAKFLCIYCKGSRHFFALPFARLPTWETRLLACRVAAAFVGWFICFTLFLNLFIVFPLFSCVCQTIQFRVLAFCFFFILFFFGFEKKCIALVSRKCAGGRVLTLKCRKAIGSDDEIGIKFFMCKQSGIACGLKGFQHVKK